MKIYRVLAFILFLLGIISINFIHVKANEMNLPLFGKIIYIDPGHGGADPGAMYKDLKEADINLEIAKVLKKTIEKRGAIVYLTRDGDYDLARPNAYQRKKSDLGTRARIINESMADMYLSIHLNAETSSLWRGAQVFYDDVNPKNEKIAEIMQKRFQKNLSSKREYKEINNGYMYKNINVPGVLIEVGFITNPSDRYLLKQSTYHQKVANNIVDGIIEYYK